MSRSMLINAALFQIGWFACVMGGNTIALLSALLVLLAHWFFISKSFAEWRLIFLVAIAGTLIDSILFATNIFTDGSERSFAPLWLISLWLIFPTTLNHSFAWLHQRLGLAIVLGAIAGPLSYLAGVKLGAVNFGVEPMQAMLVIGVIWAIFLPVSLALIARWRSPQ
jgi:hypothetical protein